MIRFLQQKDQRIIKAIFIVIIGVVSISMVIYLIPGLTGAGESAPDTYATVYPHWYSRFLSSGDEISQARVEQLTHQQLMQRNPQYADNPMIVKFFESQVGQQLVQQEVLLEAARNLGIRASDNDVLQYLHKGQLGELLFPGGVFIGQDRYAALIAQHDMSVPQFEDEVKSDIVVHRLQALITAGVSVSDQDQVRLRGPLGQRPGQDHQSLRQRSPGILHQKCGALRQGRAGRAQDHLLCFHAQ